MSWYDGMTPEEIDYAIAIGAAPGSKTPGGWVEVPGGFLVRHRQGPPLEEVVWSQPDDPSDFSPPRDRSVWCPRRLQPLVFWVLRRFGPVSGTIPRRLWPAVLFGVPLAGVAVLSAFLYCLWRLVSGL